MTDRNLSPQAQAVLDAYWKSPWDPSLQHEDRYAIASALRAAADQVAPEVYFSYTGHRDWDKGMEARNDAIREVILAIATELEGSQ
jgi:hypothetical protein